ncbi:MAG: Ger(x)C family spore germination C-terminal domain-containing protein, partial [Selenomonadales bacterium]|nr:Ger(x)C family spore germination C-terminal domain-containing protein [Selenomonadales bacterium]
RMVADITVDGVAELMELRCEADEQSGDVYTLLEEELGRAVTASVHAYLAKTKSWGADCIGLANHYRKETSSLTEWSEHDWQTLYRNADIRVHANITIKRRGYHPDEMHGGDAFAM